MIPAQVTAQVGYYAAHRRHAPALVDRIMSLRAWLEYVGQFEAADRDHMCELYLAALETPRARSTTPMAAPARREHLQELDALTDRIGPLCARPDANWARRAGQAAGDVLMRKAVPAAVEVVVASVSIPDWARALPDEVELPRLVKPAPVADPALARVAEPVLTATSVYADCDADGW